MTTQNPNNKVPHNKEAEEALLGSVLINPASAGSIHIDAQDFYIHKNAMVWEAIQRLVGRQIEPDIVTLSEELQKAGQLKEIGGAVFLTSFLNVTPSSIRADDYAEIVRDKARRRRAIISAQELAKASFDEDSDLDEAVASIMHKLTMDIIPVGGAKHISGYVSALYDDVEMRSKNPKTIWGIPTGFVDFDFITGGIQQGELFYVGGEPGIGKSILTMQMGLQMAENGFAGAIYSLEMAGLQITRRMISSLGKVRTSNMKSGNLSADEWSAVVQACDRASQLPVYISDASTLTTASLRADLAKLKARHNIQWFVLDYLYLMSDGLGVMKPIERTELLSSRLKLICKEFELAGITVSSVTKEAMRGFGSSGKSFLRGSGQVIHDADLITFLTNHIPEDYELESPNLRTLSFEKGRELENPAKRINLVKLDGYPAFGNWVSMERRNE